MRLRNILALLDDESIHLGTLKNQQVSPGVHRLRGLSTVIPAVKNLHQSGILADSAENVLRYATLSESVVDSLAVDSETANGFASAVDTLHRLATALKIALAEQFDEDRPDSVIVSLPDTTDLGLMAEVLSRLNKTLGLAAINELSPDGKVELVEFDHGSVYVVVALGLAGLSILGTLLTLVYAYREAELRIEEKRVVIEGLQLDVNIKKTIYDSLTAELEASKAALFAPLCERIPAGNHELQRRFEHAINELRLLYEQGARFYASLNAPEPIANLFASSTKALMPKAPALLSSSSVSEGGDSPD